MWFITFLMFGLSFALDACIRSVDNPYQDPYLDYLLVKTLEKALQESGRKLSCDKDAQDFYLKVTRLKEEPTAYTPFKRVNAYNLTLSLELRSGDKSKTYSRTINYFLPSGAYGNLPKRKALEDLLNIIYLDLLQDLKVYF